MLSIKAKTLDYLFLLLLKMTPNSNVVLLDILHSNLHIVTSTGKKYAFILCIKNLSNDQKLSLEEG